jgi:tetratricopeptide (TPR) repeat protein
MAERGLYSSTSFEDRAQVYAISFWPKCRQFVDLARLLEDGRQAVARASTSRLGTAQLALGAALYRNGRFAEAHRVLREGLARVLLRENTIEDQQDENGGRFLLAMAAARLGRMTEAREAYRRAVERNQTTHREKDPDMVALQSEAAALIER